MLVTPLARLAAKWKPLRPVRPRQSNDLERAPDPAGAASLDGRVEIWSRAQIERCPRWLGAFAAERKDRRYYEILEDTLRQGFLYRYFVIRDESGEVAAVQPFFVLDQDLLAGSSGAINKFAGAIRRLWPGFMRLRTLMIGCAAGEGHLDAEDESSRATLARTLASALPDCAHGLGAKLIVFKEFPASDRAALACLMDCGFTRAPSMPMTRLKLDYDDFEDYMLHALSRNMRSKLRRKYKASERQARLEMSVMSDITPIVDEVYPLYRAVFDRSKLRFEELTPEFFCSLGRKMPDKTRFFIWRKDSKIVSCALCLVDDQTLCAEYIGLDYAVAFDLRLFYVVVRGVMEWAIANGYKCYRSTGLNYAPKLHFRHELDPLDLYVRHTSPLFNFVLKRALPLLEPTRRDKLLRQFPNYGDLHAR